MKIGEFGKAVELFREDKIVYARLLQPHRVLSTCRLNGGLREDLEYIYNHQSCEPRAHTGTDLCEVAVGDPARYQKRIASKAGIAFDKSASMGTAANVKNTAMARHAFEGLEVLAMTTAGVGGNGGRVGDPASYYQSENGSVVIDQKPPVAGTINTMLFINQELSPGALVVAATVVSEAKASVLQELMAPSRYSEGIATGTGTDQLAIASRLGTPLVHTDANKHCKLGELVARAVREALFEALKLQSGLTPDSRRSTLGQLERFGENQKTFLAAVQAFLPEEKHELFVSNFLSVNHDSVTVAATQALVHLYDQFVWGVLPEACIHEIMLSQAALLAGAVCGREIGGEQLQREIAGFSPNISSASLRELVHRSIAVGFAAKWDGRFED